MAGHALHKLTDRAVKSKNDAGRYADGGGLYLQVQPGGSKSFLFMTTLGGKRHTSGVGSYPEISLSDARDKASELRESLAGEELTSLLLGGVKLSEGLEILQRRRMRKESSKTTERSFKDFAIEWMNGNLSHLSNARSRQQWYSSIEAYTKPIHNLPLADIRTPDVLACLTPIWQTKHETARRVQGRIERILAAAEVMGYREGKNPAQWRNSLDLVLPNMSHKKKHHAAMPYKDVPAFMEGLRANGSVSALCLQFLILTAARSGEARGATWQEIDLDSQIWTIPARRMKARKEHRVPLSTSCIEILYLLGPGIADEAVFCAQTSQKPLSETAVRKLMTRLKVKQYTMHGFRSTFRDWAGNETEFPRELAEEALAHQLGAVEAAYRRQQAVERRRAMMSDWEAYLQR